jgi:transcriptional regulator with XRE-family HTH domain
LIPSSPGHLPGSRDVTSPNLAAARAALNHYREQHKITVDQIAADSGLARQTVLNLLLGHHEGTLTAWFKLAQGLDLPFAAIAELLDDPAEFDGGQQPAAKPSHAPIRELIEQAMSDVFAGHTVEDVRPRALHYVIARDHPQVTASAIRGALWRMRKRRLPLPDDTKAACDGPPPAKPSERSLSDAEAYGEFRATGVLPALWATTPGDSG